MITYIRVLLLLPNYATFFCIIVTFLNVMFYSVKHNYYCSFVLYLYTRVHVPSKITANYEKSVMANFLSKTLLDTNRKWWVLFHLQFHFVFFVILFVLNLLSVLLLLQFHFFILCDALCLKSSPIASVSPSALFRTLFDTLCLASSFLASVSSSVSFCILCDAPFLKFNLLSAEFSQNRCLFASLLAM